jgi:hypothetical protein
LDDKEGAFFSEEKKQKTFMPLSRIYPAALSQDIKIFGAQMEAFPANRIRPFLAVK